MFNYFFAPITTRDNCVFVIQESLKNKRDKLLEQLNEAKFLWSSIERRGGVVTGMLDQYFTQAEHDQFSTFMKTKSTLLLQNKMLAERISSTQYQLDAVALHKFWIFTTILFLFLLYIEFLWF